MTFKQAIILIQEHQSARQERQDAVSGMLRRSKDVMPVFDVSRGIYE